MVINIKHMDSSTKLVEKYKVRDNKPRQYFKDEIEEHLSHARRTDLLRLA